MKTTLLVPTMNWTKLFNRTLVKTKILEDFEKDYFKIKEKNLLEHWKEKRLEIEISELKYKVEDLQKKKSSAMQNNEVKKVRLQLKLLDDKYDLLLEWRDNLEKERKDFYLKILKIETENKQYKKLLEISENHSWTDVIKKIKEKSEKVIANYKCKRRRRTLELFTKKILK